jgi:threonine dehydrogenase-like Zn-dependent dehydrogenase
MGHEYCGIVEDVGSEVKSVRPSQFIIGSFFAPDNTCPNSTFGYPSSCEHREFVGTAQAPVLRVPLADGTLVATPAINSLRKGGSVSYVGVPYGVELDGETLFFPHVHLQGLTRKESLKCLHG